MTETEQSERSVVVFAPYGRDAELLRLALGEAGMPARTCGDAGAVAGELARGAGVLLLTAEALSARLVEAVEAHEAAEPAWSDLPILLLASPSLTLRAPWRNLTLLHRPMASADLVAVVRLAMEARIRQYRARDLLAELERARDSLEGEVRERTRHLRAANERLQEEFDARLRVERDLDKVRRRLAAGREEERLSLARELHDDIVQRLLYTNLQLARDRKELGAGTLDAGALSERLERERQDVLETTRALRRLIAGLRPAGLDLSLKDALEDYAHKERERGGAELELELQEVGALPQDAALCLFRVAQEALRNAWKHAGASRITLRLCEEDDVVALSVQDDGRGFPVPPRLSELARADHYGLIGIEEYISALRGRLDIGSAEGKGTTVRVQVPREGAARGA